MKRISPNSPVSVFAYLVVLGLSPFPAHGLGEAQLPASRDLQTPGLVVPALSPSILPLGSEGVSVSPEQIPTAIDAKVSPEAQALPGAVKALGAAEDISAAAAKASAESDGAPVQAASDKAFDGSSIKGSNDGSGGDGVGGNGGGSNNSGPSNEGLGSFYPRVVFLQDVFVQPASEKTVQYLEKIIDAGVHLVFLTSRPLKGPGSAEEILLGQIKVRRANPIIVVSQNGGKISLHGRAANPQSIIEDIGHFPAEKLAGIQGLKASVESALQLPAGSLVEGELPKDGKAFTYTISLPVDIPEAQAPALREKMMRAYDAQLRANGQDYRMIASEQDSRSASIYSMPLRFSLPRVYKALLDQFAGEELMRHQNKFLVLADSRRSPKFSNSFSKQAEIQVVRTEADVENVLGAVLGDRTLPAVSVKLGKLRQFVEYWEPTHRNRLSSYSGESSGGSSGVSRGGNGEINQKFSMYTGTVIYQLMAWFYEQVWRGQHKFATLPVLQQRLRDMWLNPLKYGVYVNKPLADAMRSPAWKAMRWGYLDYANAFVTNFYLREFGGNDHYWLAVRDVQNNQIGLSTDRKSLITLSLRSPSTGKVYNIHTRIPRTMKLDTSEGRVLTAYSYRTGKETPDDGEQFLAEILAMSLLQGHARVGQDGKWHHGSPEGPVIAKLRVQLEYRNSPRTLIFNPEDILKLVPRAPYPQESPTKRYFDAVPGEVSAQVTSAVERMEADKDYDLYYQAHEEGVTEEEFKKMLAAKGTPLPGNQLLMRDPGAYENAANGTSTVYLRKGGDHGYQAGPGVIELKGSTKKLPVRFVSVQEMPYSKVDRKILNRLAPGLTWDEMLSTMKSYYPGFAPEDTVTVIQYRRQPAKADGKKAAKSKKRSGK